MITGPGRRDGRSKPRQGACHTSLQRDAARRELGRASPARIHRQVPLQACAGGALARAANPGPGDRRRRDGWRSGRRQCAVGEPQGGALEDVGLTAAHFGEAERAARLAGDEGAGEDHVFAPGLNTR